MDRSRRAFADETIIAVLAGGGTQEDAAKVAGVSLSTVQRRLRNQALCDRVDAARGDIVGRTLDLLTVGAAESAVVLRSIVRDQTVAAQPGASVRVSAARALLTSVLPHRDQIELAQRIDLLEKQAATRGGHLWGAPS
jgi:hypothetical protein